MKEGNGCIEIQVPDNGYVTGNDYGRLWDCNRGFVLKDEQCTAMAVPENAYLSASGDHWRCDRGFRQEGETCVAVKVPANGYLTDTSFGAGWACDRGFRKEGEMCTAIDVPKNGYLTTDTYGSGWRCDRGFKAVGNTCQAIAVPANGFLGTHGSDWECERGYQSQGDACAPSSCRKMRILITPATTGTARARSSNAAMNVLCAANRGYRPAIIKSGSGHARYCRI